MSVCWNEFVRVVRGNRRPVRKYPIFPVKSDVGLVQPVVVVRSRRQDDG